MALSDITSTTKTYKVCKGDTFSEIVERCIKVNMPGYSGLSIYNAGINKLKSYNPDINDIDLIYVGQTLTLQLSSGQSTPTKTVTKSQVAKITAFGLQAKYAADASSRRMFATWAWSKDKTEEYEVKWCYSTGDGVAFIGTKTTTKDKQYVFDAPAEALSVTFQVRPISKTYKSGNNDVHYWTASWSTTSKYNFSDNPPSVPPSDAKVDITDYKLTISLDGLTNELNATHIQIRILENDKTYRTVSVKINNEKVSYSCTCEAGKTYTIQYRSVKNSIYSDWVKLDNEYITIPAGTEGIYSIFMMSSTSVNISWYDDSTAESYEVQYTTQKELFDTGNTSGVSSITIGGEEKRTPKANTIVTGLTANSEYFFRVRSTNSKGYSAWSEIVSMGVGTIPGQPTTWSSRTTVAVGDSLTLYWMHNTEGGSRQTGARLRLTANDTTKTYDLVYGSSFSTNAENTKEVSITGFTLQDNAVIKVFMAYSNILDNVKLNVNNTGDIPVILSGTNTYYWDANSLVTFLYDSGSASWKLIDCSAEGSATSYSVDTSEYPEGTKLKWQVQTSGIVENQNGYIYSEWSIERTVDIYAQPTIALNVTDVSGDSFDLLTSLPFSISALVGPVTQKPVSYIISIISNESYETVDSVGNIQNIKAGEEVYYQYFDTSINPLSVDISANNINLQNNISYTVTCTVAMDSGLTAEISAPPFTVAWEDSELWPDAEITYDKNTYTTLIKPYCMDTITNELIEDVILSVYRREFDGSYTELATGLDNIEGTYITDPHPSLDFARYRIVAVKKTTSAVSYYDVPGYPIEEKAIIIQWNEQWTNFDVLPVDDDISYELEEPAWSGSLLRLPYNIDISNQHTNEVELIKYIGRKFPVSYYGTQEEHTSTWSFEIDKSDSKTLYGIRRLAAWIGDVYIREPSGSGYWANVSVSYDLEHCELTIPVTIDVTRVEGGV